VARKQPIRETVRGQPAATKRTTTKPTTKSTSPTGTSSAGRHTVAKGETAASIARRYSLTIRDIGRLNPGIDPARLKPGDTIRVR
jgi:membrane-bound lytic murein transglycosylase D